MPRLDRLSELSRKTLLTHPVLDFDTAPGTPLSKPLAEARLALVTTAALHRRDDRPFMPAEQEFRAFSSSSPWSDMVLSHTSISFDRAGYLRDPNVVLPLDRVRELVQQGELGSVGPTVYTFLGAQRPPYTTLQQTSGPEVARRLRDEGVDAVLLTGT